MPFPTATARVLEAHEDERCRFLPEGPREIVFDGRDALIWVNIQTAPDVTHGEIHLRFWDTGERRVLPQDARPGFVIPTDALGHVVVGRDKEIGLLDLRTNDFSPWTAIPDDNPRTIINDGEATPDGRHVVFGTKDTRFSDPIAALYLFSLDDRRIDLLADRQLCSNGKILAERDGRLLLFDIDTPTRHVVRYRIDLAARRAEREAVALDLTSIDGFPDGMCDAGGDSVIVAFYNPEYREAGEAIRFSLATGEALEGWRTPGSPRVTCPLLFERDGKTQLVLTTAVEGMPEPMRQQCPDAGCLFVADTPLPSAPPGGVIRFG